MASYNLSVGSTSTSGLLNTNNEYVKFKIQVKLTSQSTSGKSMYLSYFLEQIVDTAVIAVMVK